MARQSSRSTEASGVGPEIVRYWGGPVGEWHRGVRSGRGYHFVDMSERTWSGKL